VTHSPPFKSYSVVLPIVLLVVAMASFQLGAVVAKQLFPVVGVAGATALRLGLSSVILLAVWRPWRVRLNLSEARSIGIYGLAMGFMNLFFYSSLDRIPLGIAVALEFTGPLAVAMAASRRPIDFVWIALAAFGLIAILPLATGSQRLDPRGHRFRARGRSLLGHLYRVRSEGWQRARRSNHGAGHRGRRHLHRAHRHRTRRSGAVVACAIAGRYRRRAALDRAAVFARNVRIDPACPPGHLEC